MLVDDLDGAEDGEPEILLLVSTSGASCCTTLTVLYFDGETERYAKTEGAYLAEMAMLNRQAEGELRLQQCWLDEEEKQLLNDVLHKFNYTNN